MVQFQNQLAARAGAKQSRGQSPSDLAKEAQSMESVFNAEVDTLRRVSREIKVREARRSKEATIDSGEPGLKK